MKVADFTIGQEFSCGGSRWRCTDIGTRVIVAIKLDRDDESWYHGPPFAIVEHVFDEFDVHGCTRLEPTVAERHQ